MNELFSAKTIKKFCEKIELTTEQKKAAAEWCKLLENNELEDERTNYPKFMQIVLASILGYSIKGLVFEESHVEFAHKKHGEKILCIEAKGTSVKDVFALQHRKKEHSTPIKQLWDYMGSDNNLKYGICTNYKDFVLITKKLGYTKYHMFNFESVQTNENKLKEFIGIFSKKRIEAGFIEQLQLETDNEEKDLTEEFYELYGQTRLMLVEEFKIKGINMEEAVNFAQTFLNRIIFVFFAEDSELIDKKDMFSDSVVDILQADLGNTTKRVWSYIVEELFVYFDKGSDDPLIFGFNGGLFKDPIPEKIFISDKQYKNFFKRVESKTRRPTRQSWKFKKQIETAVKRHRDINPIIKNLLKLSSYDFKSQVRVNILGHIFENSISELEGLLQSSDLNIKLRRKREGVFYTPEYITKFICTNTIIPYLSKIKTNDIHDLIIEYEGNIEELEKKLHNIKILDPSCGSGAFLIEAASTLIEIHKEIQQYKVAHNLVESNALTKSINDVKIRTVVQDNLYGIDINFQSVEITKLSLFLMTASRQEKLQNLSDNIVVGNSVINNENFNWNIAFPKIDKFDIIIGNPPYVRQEDLKEHKKNIQIPKSNTLKLPDEFMISSASDLSSYFYYHSLNYLKDGGRLGFITSDSWLHWDYGKSLQKCLLENSKLDILMRTTFNIFEDANVKTITAILTKTTECGNAVKIINVDSKDELLQVPDAASKDILQEEFNSDNWNLYFVDPLPYPKIPMSKMEDVGKIRRGRTTGNNDFFIIDKITIKKFDIDKKYYRALVPDNIYNGSLDNVRTNKYLLYVSDSKKVLDQTKIGRRVLKYIEDNNIMIMPKKGASEKICRVSELRSVKNHKPYWYSLKLNKPATILLARFANERMKIYENSGEFYVLDNYAEFTPLDLEHIDAYMAFLTSSWFSLFLEKHGHIAGANALQLKTGDYAKAPIPKFKEIKKIKIKQLKKAWNCFKEDHDQAALDNVVLDVLGFDKSEMKAILSDLDKSVRRRIQATHDDQ